MTFQTDVFGNGIKNTAGIATIAKRKAENNMGGNSSRPILIIGKFTPHIIATNKARNILFCFTQTLYFFNTFKII